MEIVKKKYSLIKNQKKILNNLNKDWSKINPEFRRLTDILFFTDREDISIKEYSKLLSVNNTLHLKYFWDRFHKSNEIFWDSKFWNSRIGLLKSLKKKNIIYAIENKIEREFFNLLRTKSKIDIQSDIEYIKFIELCKIKKEKNESLDQIKSDLADLPVYMNSKKIIFIIQSLIPTVYSSFEEYLIPNDRISASTIQLFFDIKKSDTNLNLNNLIDLFKELLHNNSTNNYNHGKDRRTIYKIISNPELLLKIKEVWTEKDFEKFRELIKSSSFRELNENNFKIIKIILELDSNLMDDIVETYLNTLYSRYVSHKRANIDRVIALLNYFNQISPKKILLWLCSNNKNYDIKYLMNAFPNIKALSAFA